MPITGVDVELDLQSDGVRVLVTVRVTGKTGVEMEALTLWVTEGHGLVQARGEKVVSLQAGDVHTTPDGLEHWHGATPDHLMSHLSITQGTPNWGDHVTDEEYSAG